MTAVEQAQALASAHPVYYGLACVVAGHFLPKAAAWLKTFLADEQEKLLRGLGVDPGSIRSIEKKEAEALRAEAEELEKRANQDDPPQEKKP